MSVTLNLLVVWCLNPVRLVRHQFDGFSFAGNSFCKNLQGGLLLRELKRIIYECYIESLGGWCQARTTCSSSV